MKKILMFFWAVVTISSCQPQAQMSSEKVADTIFVSYYPTPIDFSVAPMCSDLLDKANELSFIHDTIRISQKDYDEIAALVKGAHHVLPDCVMPPTLCVQMGDSCIGIWDGNGWCGSFTCNRESRMIKDNPETVYKIKCLSNYYNCLEKDWVIEDSLVKRFGFPPNYKYSHKHKEYIEVKDEDSPYDEMIILNYDEEEEEREWGFRKVALVLDES